MPKTKGGAIANLVGKELASDRSKVEDLMPNPRAIRGNTNMPEISKFKN